MILTVSRMSEEKRANPGYRAFFANGFNVTRVLVLFVWEVILERIAAGRQIRRKVNPRGERTRKYALLRAALCVGVRDLIVYGVLTDMMRGRPAVYATFSSYDEVAHHSGLERADTLEALRKLDQQFARIARARRFAPRPYKLVVLSDHGQTQGATFKQRNGYGLSELVQRSIEQGTIATVKDGDENDAAVGHAVTEATGGAQSKTSDELGDQHVVVLGSGNLGLIYLMEERRRLTLEEINDRHPRLIPALREHPHVGFLLVRSRDHGPVVLGARGAHYLADGRVEGDDPLAAFSPNAPAHLRRTDGFDHVADIMVNSFYDSELEQGCAFEELISFHGGMGGPQTRPFLLSPVELSLPDQPIVGAAHVHGVLTGWRASLQDFVDGDGGAHRHRRLIAPRVATIGPDHTLRYGHGQGEHSARAPGERNAAVHRRLDRARPLAARRRGALRDQDRPIVRADGRDEGQLLLALLGSPGIHGGAGRAVGRRPRCGPSVVSGARAPRSSLSACSA